MTDNDEMQIDAIHAREADLQAMVALMNHVDKCGHDLIADTFALAMFPDSYNGGQYRFTGSTEIVRYSSLNGGMWHVTYVHADDDPHSDDAEVRGFDGVEFYYPDGMPQIDVPDVPAIATAVFNEFHSVWRHRELVKRYGDDWAGERYGDEGR
jgi:hypothetical protein